MAESGGMMTEREKRRKQIEGLQQSCVTHENIIDQNSHLCRSCGYQLQRQSLNQPAKLGIYMYMQAVIPCTCTGHVQFASSDARNYDGCMTYTHRHHHEINACGKVPTCTCTSMSMHLALAISYGHCAM